MELQLLVILCIGLLQKGFCFSSTSSSSMYRTITFDCGTGCRTQDLLCKDIEQRCILGEDCLSFLTKVIRAQNCNEYRDRIKNCLNTASIDDKPDGLDQACIRFSSMFFSSESCYRTDTFTIGELETFLTTQDDSNASQFRRCFLGSNVFTNEALNKNGILNLATWNLASDKVAVISNRIDNGGCGNSQANITTLMECLFTGAACYYREI